VNQFVKLLWSEYKIPICVVAAILAIVYLANLSDASLNPWTLWRREWIDTTEGVTQRRLGSFKTEKACSEEQGRRLKLALDMKKEAKIALPNDLKFLIAYIQEGHTIFGFRKSILSTLKETASLPVEMFLPEINSEESYFCAPTSTHYGLWPYYIPRYDAGSDALYRLGEKTLAIRAKQLLGE
jgi:hypothetical protein